MQIGCLPLGFPFLRAGVFPTQLLVIDKFFLVWIVIATMIRIVLWFGLSLSRCGHVFLEIWEKCIRGSGGLGPLVFSDSRGCIGRIPWGGLQKGMWLQFLVYILPLCLCDLGSGFLFLLVGHL